MSGALDGVRVIEFANYVSGPYAGMMLGDLGAEVIKVEMPGQGDPFRAWGTATFSPTFESLNRNKKSVEIDLKSAAGCELAARLTDTADVLIENFRPGVMQRMGLDWPALSARNKRLVYCTITGFGDDGPYRDRPGYDTIGQAMSGLLSLLTELDAPKPMGYSLGDHLGGAAAYQGILAALFARERSGRGQHVSTSLLESCLAFVGENASRFFHDKKVPGRKDRTRIAQVYACVAGDGKPMVVHLSSPQKFFEALATAAGHPEWIGDERFATRARRLADYDAFHEALAAVFVTDTREAWLERLRAADVPCSPIYDFAEVFEDAQVRHLAMRHDIADPAKGTISVVRGGVRFSDTPAEIRTASPALGADNEAILGPLRG